MSAEQLAAAESMYRALNLLPCRCQHNVPYATGKVEQKVVKQCDRCSSMAAWQLANQGKLG